MGDRVEVWMRPHARSWVRAALEAEGSLYGWAATSARGSGENPLTGRGPVHLVPGTRPAERWAVRHYWRGGALASLPRDRYLRGPGLPRPFAEWLASEGLTARGFSTPEVIAAAVYRRGTIYRGDLVTRFIPDGRDVGVLLFNASSIRSGDDPMAGPPPSEARVRLLESVGALVRRLGLGGVFHPDLNAKNILVTGWTQEPRLHVLDLDRVRLRPRPLGDEGGGMLRRLLRSLRKMAKAASGAGLDPADEAAVTEGFQRPVEEGPPGTDPTAGPN